MKTVKTINGVKRIDNLDIPFQLKLILKEHRLTLVNKLLTGGLETYLDYKFNTKATSGQLQQVKVRLDELKHAGIDTEAYGQVFETVSRNSATILGNTLFYREIDEAIKETLFRSPLLDAGYHTPDA